LYKKKYGTIKNLSDYNFLKGFNVSCYYFFLKYFIKLQLNPIMALSNSRQKSCSLIEALVSLAISYFSLFEHPQLESEGNIFTSSVSNSFIGWFFFLFAVFLSRG